MSFHAFHRSLHLATTGHRHISNRDEREILMDIGANKVIRSKHKTGRVGAEILSGHYQAVHRCLLNVYGDSRKTIDITLDMNMRHTLVRCLNH